MPWVPNSCLQTWCWGFWLTFWLWGPSQRLSVVHYIILDTCWVIACVGKIVLSAISTKFCCFKCLCLPSATFIGFGFSTPPPFLFYGAKFWAVFWKPWPCWLLSHGWDQKAWEAGGTDRASLVKRISGKAFGQWSWLLLRKTQWLLPFSSASPDSQSLIQSLQGLRNVILRKIHSADPC